MKKITKYLFGFLFLLLSVVIMNSYATKRKVRISDVKQKTIIVLQKKSSQGGIYGIKINIFGHINKRAKLF